MWEDCRWERFQPFAALSAGQKPFGRGGPWMDGAGFGVLIFEVDQIISGVFASAGHYAEDFFHTPTSKTCRGDQ